MTTREDGSNLSGEEQTTAVVLLKAGTRMPPIFIAPGIGDTAEHLSQFANLLQVAHPVYGLQPRGRNGVDEPLRRIEEIAEFHCHSIQHLQPHGPYILIGHSLGGLVMLEVARRLGKANETVSLLAMLDSYPSRNNLSLPQHAALTLRLVMRRAVSLLRRSQPSQPHPRGAPSERPQEESMVRGGKAIKDSAYDAWRNYRPSFYSGKIRFVKAAIPTFFPSDPAAVWAHLTNEFQIETIPGAHLDMVTTQLETLSSVVARYVGEALAGN
jgi:thioesterase domain-containing protein